MDETEQEGPGFGRRSVLSSIGGVVAAGAFAAPASAGLAADTEVDRMAEAFEGVQTEQDRRTLEFLVEEMDSDAELLAENDLEELSDETRREFAWKGRLMRGMMASQCGPHPYEISLGKYTKCCEFHDGCETYNDAPDHIFNGDACDEAFWSCVSNI